MLMLVIVIDPAFVALRRGVGALPSVTSATLTVVISAFRIANTTAITSRAKRGLVGREDEESVTRIAPYYQSDPVCPAAPACISKRWKQRRSGPIARPNFFAAYRLSKQRSAQSRQQRR